MKRCAGAGSITSELARAVLAQHAYAVANPEGWAGLRAVALGTHGSMDPAPRVEIGGKMRPSSDTYWARGASFTEVQG